MIILAAFDVARIAACRCKDGHGMHAFMQRYLAEIGMLKLGVSTLPETSQTSLLGTSYCNRNGPCPGKELEYCAENLAASSGPVLWASRLNNCPC